MFIYWYKKKMFGPFKEDMCNEFKDIIVKKNVDLGIFNNLPDQEIEGAEYTDFLTITNDEEFKKKLDITT